MMAAQQAKEIAARLEREKREAERAAQLVAEEKANGHPYEELETERQRLLQDMSDSERASSLVSNLGSRVPRLIDIER